MSAFIDPHIPMISRPPDDYHRLALAGNSYLRPQRKEAKIGRGFRPPCGVGETCAMFSLAGRDSALGSVHFHAATRP